MNTIIEHLKELFEDSIANDFKEFIRVNGNGKCYLILSDYALHNKNKSNEVITFTILTGDADEINQIISTTKKYAKKDIKHARSINGEFIKLLRRKRLFHINFLLGERKLFKQQGAATREGLLKSLNFTISELSSSNRTDILEGIEKLKQFRSDVAKKTSNLKLMTDICLLSLLTAYIMYLLTKEGMTEVAWMSDRDKMVEAYSEIAFTLCQLNYLAVCVKNEVPTKEVKNITYFTTSKGISYVDLVRIPDYLAGTLADWSKESPAVSKEKFVGILKYVISDNKFCKVFSLSFSDTQMNCSEYKLTNTQKNKQR